MAINNVVLVGRLTKDPEVRKTTTGLSTCQFNLAVDRNLSKEKREEQGVQTADFPTCVAFRGTADFLGNYCHKGDKLSIYGRIQTRTYDDQQGVKHYVTEVLVNELHNESDRRSSDTNNQVVNNNQYSQPVQSNGNYYQGNNNRNNYPQNDDKFIDISSDDLPF